MNDDLSMARGIAVAFVLGAAFWAVVVTVVVWELR